jgi:hypothetical protein
MPIVIGTLWKTRAAHRALIDQQDGSFTLRVCAGSRTLYDEDIGPATNPYRRAQELQQEYDAGARPTPSVAAAWQRRHRTEAELTAAVLWAESHHLYGVYVGGPGASAPLACWTHSLATAQLAADDLVQARDPHDCEATGCRSWAPVGGPQ